jgi:hypothetical protein
VFIESIGHGVHLRPSSKPIRACQSDTVVRFGTVNGHGIAVTTTFERSSGSKYSPRSMDFCPILARPLQFSIQDKVNVMSKVSVLQMWKRIVVRFRIQWCTQHCSTRYIRFDHQPDASNDACLDEKGEQSKRGLHLL